MFAAAAQRTAACAPATSDGRATASGDGVMSLRRLIGRLASAKAASDGKSAVAEGMARKHAPSVNGGSESASLLVSSGAPPPFPTPAATTSVLATSPAPPPCRPSLSGGSASHVSAATSYRSTASLASTLSAVSPPMNTMRPSPSSTAISPARRVGMGDASCHVPSPSKSNHSTGPTVCVNTSNSSSPLGVSRPPPMTSRVPDTAAPKWSRAYLGAAPMSNHEQLEGSKRVKPE
mmetsp:Transcript_32067/g.70197  ORF Transcript_32067/g.70197 Transcript_32067/m.70197 type:complete len:234 (+) Transcript_32067:5463-6164(+)